MMRSMFDRGTVLACSKGATGWLGSSAIKGECESIKTTRRKEVQLDTPFATKTNRIALESCITTIRPSVYSNLGIPCSTKANGARFRELPLFYLSLPKSVIGLESSESCLPLQSIRRTKRRRETHENARRTESRRKRLARANTRAISPPQEHTSSVPVSGLGITRSQSAKSARQRPEDQGRGLAMGTEFAPPGSG